MLTRIWNKIASSFVTPEGQHSGGPICMQCSYLRRRIAELDDEIDKLEEMRALHLARNHQDENQAQLTARAGRLNDALPRRGSFLSHADEFPEAHERPR